MEDISSVLLLLMLCLVTQLCPTLCDPMDCSPLGSSVHGDSPGKNTEMGCHALFQGIFPTQGSSPPGIEHRSPTLQVDSLPTEPQGKPKNTGVSSLSLLQRIFPTQESNKGLLHCRQILYLLSYEGSYEGGGKGELWKQQSSWLVLFWNWQAL